MRRRLAAGVDILDSVFDEEVSAEVSVGKYGCEHALVVMMFSMRL